MHPMKALLPLSLTALGACRVAVATRAFRWKPSWPTDYSARDSRYGLRRMAGGATITTGDGGGDREIRPIGAHQGGVHGDAAAHVCAVVHLQCARCSSGRDVIMPLRGRRTK